MCAGRKEILQAHIQKQGLPLGEDVTVDSIAASTTGFTGADLANLINEAALLAGRSDKGACPPHLLVSLSSSLSRLPLLPLLLFLPALFSLLHLLLLLLVLLLHPLIVWGV